MFLGIDVSTYFDEQEIGAKYYLNNQEVDPMKLLVEQGVKYMRIRVWHNPYDEEGHPYLAGTNDINKFIMLSDLAVKYGLRIILDIHYSDFWADPGKQFLPKAWKDLSFEEVEQKVYEHTKDIFKVIREHNFPVDYVQVGNEITNGMLWPYGRLDESVSPRGNYEGLAKLLKQGVKAVREESNAKIIIHLERSYDQPAYFEYFSNIIRLGVDFDIIGFSYYPYWHGTFDQFFANVKMCKDNFHKEVMVMELGYGFTLEDYIKSGSQAQLVINADKTDFLANLPYPISPEGQALFIREFLKRAKEAEMVGVNYWEPLWIPGPGICWASEAAQKYIHEEGKSTRNEWANQCLFDYQGKALPALKEFKIDGK